MPNIAFGGFIYGVDILPPNPGSSDFILANIYGDFSTTGVTIPNNPTVSIIGEDIFVDIFSIAEGIGLTILWPYSTSAAIGLLPKGNYNLTANLYLNNIIDDTFTQTISVSAVPIPAAVWLFSSGLFGLAGVARRKAHA